MKKLLLHWLLSAMAVWIVSQTIPGITVSGLFAALFAALAIGFINGTLGFALKLITLPLTVVTLGLFWLLINAAMLKLSSMIIPGFHIDGFAAAFFGGIVLSIVNTVLKYLVK